MPRLSIAGTIWLATALLHLDDLEAEGFDNETILRRVAELDPSLDPRRVAAHLVTSTQATPTPLHAPIASLIEEDPILALTGVGKEMWKNLGGGEAFIRRLREE